MLSSSSFSVIGGQGNHNLDKDIIKVVNKLGYEDLRFHHLIIDKYPDGEENVRVEDYKSLKDTHLLLFQSIHNEHLMVQLKQLAWTCKVQYGVKSITAIIPFMRYRRQDHDEKSREITRLRWLIHNLAVNYVDRILFCDIHSKKACDYCQEEGIEYNNVVPSSAFAASMEGYVDIAKDAGRDFIVYAPDEGAVARAIDLAREMGGARVVMTLKKRDDLNDPIIYEDDDKVRELAVEHDYPIESANKAIVEGASIVIRDDELSTGGTARKTGWYAKKNLKAFEVFFCATHAVCTPNWHTQFLEKSPYQHAFLANTIPRGYDKSTGGKATTVEVSQVMGNRLFRIMGGIK